MQFDVSSNDSMVPPTSQYSYNKLTHTFVSMLSMILDDWSNWYFPKHFNSRSIIHHSFRLHYITQMHCWRSESTGYHI